MTTVEIKKTKFFVEANATNKERDASSVWLSLDALAQCCVLYLRQ